MVRKVVLVCNINYTGRPLHPIKNSPARNFIREELKWYFQEQYHSKTFKIFGRLYSVAAFETSEFSEVFY